MLAIHPSFDGTDTANCDRCHMLAPLTRLFVTPVATISLCKRCLDSVTHDGSTTAGAADDHRGTRKNGGVKRA